MSWLDMTIATKTSDATLKKIFSSKTNFFVESVWKILVALRLTLIVEEAGKRYEIMNQTELNTWAQKSQKSCGLSVNKFKDEIGMTRVAVTANLNGESKMRINTFLKWAEITGYQVEMIK